MGVRVPGRARRGGQGAQVRPVVRESLSGLERVMSRLPVHRRTTNWYRLFLSYASDIA